MSENPGVVDVLKREGAVPDIVDGANGKKILNTENAYDTLSKKISAIEDNELQPKLQSLDTGKISDTRPLEDLRQNAITKVKEALKSSGNADAGVVKVNKFFDSYQKSYGDYVTLSDINDMKRGIRGSVNFNSEVVDQNVAYQVGQVFMKDIETQATKLGLGDIHEINDRMAQLIKDQDSLEKLNGKPAPLKGWKGFKANNPIKAKLVSHVAKGAAGAAVGSLFGQKGAVAGGIIGGGI